MLSKLAKIANRLDSLGLTREADVLDAFICKFAAKVATPVERTAVIITGNPKFIIENPEADQFYATLAEILQEAGYRVSFDPGEPYTTPPPADVWVGHSRGVDRLRFAPEHTKTIAIGSRVAGSINNPAAHEEEFSLGARPLPAHFQLTPKMERELRARIE
jgi:hypothetical protein